jgi:hypothetical protein
MFLSVALCSGQVASFVENRYEYPLHSWSWWTVSELRKLSSALSLDRAGRSDTLMLPNTVLLGSSLMVVANAECDATWQQERIDLTTYRGARYFDAVMNDRLSAPGSPIESRSINLSAPGQIPSDAFLTLQEALNEGLRPSLVVYGVAPRDFLDSTMSSPYETETYKYLSRLVSTTAIDSRLRDDVFRSLGRHLFSSLPLLRYAVDIQMLVGKAMMEVCDCFSGGSSDTISLEKRMALMGRYKPLDMVPGFIHAEITRGADVDKLYADNLSDYRARYGRPEADFYDGQIACFEVLARFCREREIDLVVVNMPIRKCNLDLLDPGIHSKYIADVSRVSTEYGALFLDLCKVDEYSKRDYRDSVHLNGFGGRKFLDRLALCLAKADCSQTIRAVHRQFPRVAAQETAESPL